MSFSTILAPIEAGDVARAPFQAALRLAKRFGAKLDVLSYAAAPTAALTGGVLSVGAVDETLEALRGVAAATLQEASQAAEKAGVEYEASLMASPLISLQEAVAQRALFADLIVAPRLEKSGGDRGNVIHGALFHGPTPLLVWPPELASEAADRVGGNVLIAWDGRKPASAATRLATPILSKAQAITILCVERGFSDASPEEGPGEAFADWLKRRGIAASLRVVEEADIAETISDSARELGADLIVMGGYGHSQMMEAIFGGVTETMLRSAPAPLFMAH